MAKALKKDMRSEDLDLPIEPHTKLILKIVHFFNVFRRQRHQGILYLKSNLHELGLKEKGQFVVQTFKEQVLLPIWETRED